MKTSALLPLLLSLVIRASSFSAESARPNIISILVDDIGVGDFGFSGGKDFPTPNIDRLAREGCIFTNAYVNPMCAPTRAAMLMGRYPQRLGIEDNRPLDGENVGLDVNEVLLPKRLREAGYYTKLVGKWHLGKGARGEFTPRARGFDDFYGYFGAAGQYVNPKLTRDGVEQPTNGYNTDLLTDEAIATIKAQRDKPFFIHLAYMAVHPPVVAREVDRARVPQLKGKRQAAAAITINLDDNIGRLLAALKESGQDDKTLIFFTSDNGAHAGFIGTSNGPFRGEKFEVTEGGIHVPFAMRWPGKITAGSRFEPMVHVMDVFTTSMKLAQPEVDTTQLDGVDLMPYLAKAKTGVPHETLYWLVGDWQEWSKRDRDTNLARKLAAVRSGDDKLILFGDSEPQLYNLAADPGEQHDLAKEQPQRVLELKQELDAWRAQMKPQLIPANHAIYGSDRLRKANAAAPMPAGAPRISIIQENGQWWFRTPEGKKFISLGVTHTTPDWGAEWTRSLADSAFGGSFAKTEDFVRQQFADMHFNTMGYHPAPNLRGEFFYQTMCFPLPIWYREVGKGFSCPDVFDAEIEKGMRAQIAKMCEPERGQKNLIGYWFTDVPLWDLERSQMRYQKDWVTELRRLPATTPGKAAYVRFLLQRYQSKPEQMQQHYGITSKDEAALMQHDFSAITRSSEVIKADDNNFLGIIAERYYSICASEVRLRDPGALVLGDRYAENDHTPQVLAAAGRYIDAVSLQPSSDRYVPGYLEKLHHQSGGKPVIIADYRIGFPVAGFPKHTWRGYPTEAEAAAATKDYITRAFAEPWVIGYNHCELADKPHGRTKDVIRNGFFSVEGKPYAELVRATREANETVLRQRGCASAGLLFAQ